MEIGEFFFRIWLNFGDDFKVETWCQELEPTTLQKRSIAEWALDALNERDIHDHFDLDEDKCWQIVGKAFIKGWHNSYDGEYEEDLDIVEYQTCEVPPSYMKWVFGFECEENEPSPNTAERSDEYESPQLFLNFAGDNDV